jgi:hypothetical protein
MVGRYDRPAALLGLEKHVDEVRIGDAEQRVDAFGLEQMQNTLIDGDSHGRSSPELQAAFWVSARFAIMRAALA